MGNAVRILVIDDETQMSRLLRITLEAGGYDVCVALTAADGIQQAAMQRPELIILDLGLPDMDGLDALVKLREWATIPVLVLSVRSSEQDIISALDRGADDYLTKPFRGGELLARIRSALRRRDQVSGESVLHAGPLTIDLAARVVTKNGEAVKLTPTEYQLLALFVRNAGKVLTHRYILQQIWGPTFEEESQYSRIYVAQLRKKLEEDPAHPKIFRTESGIGYRMIVDAGSPA